MPKHVDHNFTVQLVPNQAFLADCTTPVRDLPSTYLLHVSCERCGMFIVDAPASRALLSGVEPFVCKVCGWQFVVTRIVREPRIAVHKGGFYASIWLH